MGLGKMPFMNFTQRMVQFPGLPSPRQVDSRCVSALFESISLLKRVCLLNGIVLWRIYLFEKTRKRSNNEIMAYYITTSFL